MAELLRSHNCYSSETTSLEDGRDLSTIEIRMLWTLGSQGPSRGAELAEALSSR